MKQSYIRKIDEDEFLILKLKMVKCEGELRQYTINARSKREQKAIVTGMYTDCHSEVMVDIVVNDIFTYDHDYYVVTDKKQLLRLCRNGGKPTNIQRALREFAKQNV